MYNLRLTPVVRILLIANAVMYVATTYIVPDLAHYLYAYYPSSPDFLAHQVLTHMFMHDPDSIFHIFFNMFCLASFGPVIEMVWREQKFFFFYLFCGFGAIGLHYAVEYWQIEQGIRSLESAQYSPLMGASGCISGVIVAFAMLNPNQKIGIMFIPVYFPAKYFVPVIFAGDLFLGLSNYHTGIAHFAHLGGAISGFLLISYWWKMGK
jgi:membrane associated rhomboid family serine protease